MAFRRTVDHPDVVAGAAEIIAHFFKAWAVEKPRSTVIKQTMPSRGPEPGLKGLGSKTFQVAHLQK